MVLTVARNSCPTVTTDTHPLTSGDPEYSKIPFIDMRSLSVIPFWRYGGTKCLSADRKNGFVRLQVIYSL